ncbi:hypothetical protein GCM10009559_21150 [Pseudonocardia zijingensis]|uniref:Uncharacterized protein n=1 Tax=Pseudonocardia zijingensis TaxID=153376 RepID=A0ABP4AAG3_9PSEU
MLGDQCRGGSQHPALGLFATLSLRAASGGLIGHQGCSHMGSIKHIRARPGRRRGLTAPGFRGTHRSDPTSVGGLLVAPRIVRGGLRGQARACPVGARHHQAAASPCLRGGAGGFAAIKGKRSLPEII